MDNPQGSWRIKQRILALVLASVVLMINVTGPIPPARALAPAVVINSASNGTLGSFNVVKVNLTSEWASSMDLVVFAVWKNSGGQTVAVSTGGLTLASGATGAAFAPLISAPARGSYVVTVFAVTTDSNPVSAATSLSLTI